MDEAGGWTTGWRDRWMKTEKERPRPAEALYRVFINTLMNGWRDRWRDDGWTERWLYRWSERRMDGWMDGWKDGWLKIQSQLLSTVHEIRTWWPIVIQHTPPLPRSAQIFGLLPSLFYSFLCNTRLFSPGDELPQHTISLISARIPLSLGLSVINSLSWGPSPSLFSLSTSQLLFCSALVLLVLKRSACMITTRPDLRRKSGERERQMKKSWAGER